MSNRILDLTLEPVLNLPCRFGRYRLTKLLAQGGMAQIYLAKAFGAEGFVKPLVIKRLTPSLTANKYFGTLFVNEAKLLVTLTHGNIVPVFDFGRVGDDLFMAIEYVNGASVRQVMNALTQMDERFDPELVAYIGAEVCKGLGYAHRRSDARGQAAGIVHRDIKPTNVLISMDGEVKIVDFGVAKLAGRVEGQGQLTGTIAYMSPEQAERHPVDHHTDIFSTGLLLYELLTFRRAYDVESPKEALALARRAAIPALPPQVPAQLREIIVRATRPAPEDRYATAGEMEMALSDFLVQSRAARTGETQSPTSRLSELMKRLPVERVEVDVTAEDLDPTQPAEDLHDEVSGLLEPGDAPDLNLMKNAAETFHSEFLTRVLREELMAGPGGRRISRLLLVLVPLLAIAAVGLGFWVTSRRSGHGGSVARAGSSSAAVAVTRAADGAGRPAVPLDRGKSPSDAAPASRESASLDQGFPPEVIKVGASRPRFGYLNLNSIPWSEVSVDGHPVGRPTPLLKLRLRAGAHTVLLTNREKGLKKSIQISIRAGAVTWKVVRLK